MHGFVRHPAAGAWMSMAFISACNNTKRGMEKAEGHPIAIMPDATVIPSGVVHLNELQEQGWSYVKP